MKTTKEKTAIYGKRVEITQEGRYKGKVGTVLDGYNSMNATHDHVYTIDIGTKFLVPIHEDFVKEIKEGA